MAEPAFSSSVPASFMPHDRVMTAREVRENRKLTPYKRPILTPLAWLFVAVVHGGFVAFFRAGR